MFLKSGDKPLDTTHFGSFDSITKPLNIKLNETSFFFLIEEKMWFYSNIERKLAYMESEC